MLEQDALFVDNESPNFTPNFNSTLAQMKSRNGLIPMNGRNILQILII